MKKIIATTALVLATATAQPALAWGDREQGIVSGIAAILLLQKLNNNSQPHTTTPPPVVDRGVVYVDRNSVQRCGYVGQAYYQDNWVISEKRNRCTGELVERTIRPRY